MDCIYCGKSFIQGETLKVVSCRHNPQMLVHQFNCLPSLRELDDRSGGRLQIGADWDVSAVVLPKLSKEYGE